MASYPLSHPLFHPSSHYMRCEESGETRPKVATSILQIDKSIINNQSLNLLLDFRFLKIMVVLIAKYKNHILSGFEILNLQKFISLKHASISFIKETTYYKMYSFCLVNLQNAYVISCKMYI